MTFKICCIKSNVKWFGRNTKINIFKIGNLYQPRHIGESIAIETSQSVLTPTTAGHTVHTMNSETGDSTAKDLLQTTQVEAGKTTTGQTNFTVQATQEYGGESSFRKTDDILVGQANLYCNEGKSDC